MLKTILKILYYIKVKMSITDICESILNKCDYNSTTYSNIDELNFIKYRIYNIFINLPIR
jgi:hypothetical protein